MFKNTRKSTDKIKLKQEAKGKSLSEYVLILGLVVLIAVPTLGFLSGNISDLLAPPKQSQYDELTVLLSPEHYAENNSSNSLPNISSNNSSLSYTNFQNNGGSITFNSSTLSLPGNNDISMVAQSGQGNDIAVLTTSILSDQMLSLADQMEADGSPADLIALLRATGALGHDLANAEESWNNLCTDPANCLVNSNTGGDPNREVYDAHWLYTDTANQLLNKFKVDYNADTTSDAAMKNFFELSLQYVGGIDEVGGVLYSNQVAAEIGKVDAFGQVEVPSTNSSFDLVNSGITLDIAPQFTEATASRLESAQQEALEETLASSLP